MSDRMMEIPGQNHRELEKSKEFEMARQEREQAQLDKEFEEYPAKL